MGGVEGVHQPIRISSNATHHKLWMSRWSTYTSILTTITAAATTTTTQSKEAGEVRMQAAVD